MAADIGGNTGNRNGRGVKRWRIVIWGSAAALWLLPLVAMRFDSGVNWSAGDFVVLGVLLLATCSALELASALFRSRRARVGAGIAVVLGFLWLWAELAVGVFTDWGS